MEDLCERIERAALLRAVRILAARAHPAAYDAGTAFLAEYCAEDAAFLQLLRADAGASDDAIGWILDAAQRLAGAGTSASEHAAPHEPAHLESVFNRFGAADGAKEGFPIRSLTDGAGMLFPCPVGDLDDAVRGHREVCDRLARHFARKSPVHMPLGELLRVLEETMSYVPSPAGADIALYDYARMTAAYAAALHRYAAAQDIHSAHTYEERGGEALPAFLLVSADISGIQPFIYAIPSKGALKSLRGRSFYLEILLENIVDEILSACGISRSALLYTGGGHFYLLLPNTEDVQNLLTRCHTEGNSWMLEHFGSSLYLAMAWTACTGAELAGQGTQEAFRRVSEGLSAEKLCRYSEDQLAAMFVPESAWNKTRDKERECAVCHTSTTHLMPYSADPSIEACGMCSHLFTFGERILTKNAFCVSAERGAEALSLPGIGRTLYLTAEELDDVDRLSYKIERIYAKNAAYTGDLPAAHLWLGDYSARENKAVLEMENLARRSGGTEDSKGIPRIGVMRADVDNLGAAFLAGFPSEYATMTRTAALSQRLSLFFKHYTTSSAAAVSAVSATDKRPRPSPSLAEKRRRSATSTSSTRAETTSSSSARGTTSSSSPLICAALSCALRAANFASRLGSASSRTNAPSPRWRAAPATSSRAQRISAARTADRRRTALPSLARSPRGTPSQSSSDTRRSTAGTYSSTVSAGRNSPSCVRTAPLTAHRIRRACRLARARYTACSVSSRRTEPPSSSHALRIRLRAWIQGRKALPRKPMHAYAHSFTNGIGT